MAMAEKRVIERTFRGWTPEPFHIPNHFKDWEGKRKASSRKNLANDAESASSPAIAFSNTVDFARIKSTVTEYFKSKYDHNEKEQDRWIERKHGAVTGNPAAIEWFKKEIEDILIRNNWLNCEFPFPNAYGDIVEAVYQETYGIGPISTWKRHPRYHESEAASIIGTKVFFEFPGEDEPELQDIYYDSPEDVIRIANQLSLRYEKSSLNRRNPSLEIDMEDGSRVTISIPPLTVEPVVTFRHFTIPRPTFTLLAEKRTYPLEIVPVLDALTLGRLTTIWAGPVKSGKTIMMKAAVAKRRSNDTVLVFHKDFDETRFHQQLPHHKFKQFIINDQNMVSTFPIALRSDYDYLIVTECRSFEADIFLKSASRGLPGALTNLHILDPKDIPAELAELVIEEFPTKSYESLYRKAAKSIHLVYELEELKDKSKRLNRIILFDWDDDTRRLSTTDLMTWDFDYHEWIFNDYIPPRILKILNRFAPKETERAIEVLKRLVDQQRREGLVHHELRKSVL